MTPAVLFVYGTLQPGHLRWPVVAPFATGHRPARVRGRLYDGGAGWPVACFDAAAGPVPGAAVEIEPGGVDHLLALLDEVEGVADGRYRRTIVALDGGPATAWAYHWTGPTSDLVPIDAWTDQPER